MADQFTAGETFTEDEQVTHTKLNLAQTNLKFTSNAVDGSTTAISSEAIIVKSGGITATQLASNAVEEAKINNGAVTADKLGADCVSGAKIADNSIDSEHYVDGSIDQEHLNADVITGQTELAAIPHLTQDEVLISDNGTLKRLKLMSYLPLPRAYGLIKADGGIGTADAVSLYNCTCTAASGVTYTFDLGSNMSSADYSVLAQQHSTAAWDDEWDNHTVELVDANTFKIHVATTSSPYHVSFAVFGTLA
tara:strand:- start:17407 stop:18156 length:750 start_codon:yes stop_codon:yes gene_type:complete